MATEAPDIVESIGNNGDSSNGYNMVTKFFMALGWDLKLLRFPSHTADGRYSILEQKFHRYANLMSVQLCFSDENMADIPNNEWRTQTIFLVLNDRDLFIGTVTFLAACIAIIMLFLLTIKFVFHLILMPKSSKTKVELELPMYHKNG